MAETEDKRMKLIWAAVVLMAGIAILATLIIPAVGFWEGVGIFLCGIGIISACLLLFMGKRASPVFSLLVVLAGALLLARGLLSGLIPGLSSGVLLGAALVIIAVGAIIMIGMKK